MTPLRDHLESIVTLTKIWKRDRALKPIERRLAADMRKAFREHRAAFMREFERLGPGILGEASPLPAIEGALEAAYQATFADFLAPIEEAAGAAIAAAAKHRVAEFGIDYAFDLKNPVVPHAGTWIEMRRSGRLSRSPPSRASRRHVD